MSQSLRPLLFFACLVALPALSAQGVESATTCPDTSSDEAASAQAQAAPAASERGAAGKARGADSGADAAPVQRSRPRWQSFLPGMVR